MENTKNHQIRSVSGHNFLTFCLLFYSCCLLPSFIHCENVKVEVRPLHPHAKIIVSLIAKTSAQKSSLEWICGFVWLPFVSGCRQIVIRCTQSLKPPIFPLFTLHHAGKDNNIQMHSNKAAVNPVLSQKHDSKCAHKYMTQYLQLWLLEYQPVRVHCNNTFLQYERHNFTCEMNMQRS